MVKPSLVGLQQTLVGPMVGWCLAKEKGFNMIDHMGWLGGVGHPHMTGSQIL